MISTVIIEDEPKSRASLAAKLREFCPTVEIVAEAEDGIEGKAMIEKHAPQLVFLDIEMPNLNGFEMLNAIPEKKFNVIFTTAYDQYAIKAIRYAAFDYLLKPVDVEELKAAVAKLSAINTAVIDMQASLLQEKMLHPMKHLNKLAIPTMDGIMFYNINDIVQLEANRNYTNIFFIDRSKITASKTLKDFEELLPADVFFRAHHSHIINLGYIKRYIKGDGGQIELQTGVYVDVSRRKKEEFLKAIGY